MQTLPMRTLTRRQLRKRDRLPKNNFASYLSFGSYSTALLAFFFFCYVVVMICISPMLDTTREGPPKRGVRFSGFKGAHLPQKEDVIHVANAVRDKWGKLRSGFGHKHTNLMSDARAEFEGLRAKKERLIPAVNLGGKRNGFLVLGMHRSGTSMLSGLLVEGNGYIVGDGLIKASFDNEKGFYERVDVVLQNDEFMKTQGIWWGDKVAHYDPEKALEDKKRGTITFKDGETGLAFLNDKSNAPWLEKDPRMCITLRTWLPLLNTEPAIIFTYRHPLEVARSLKARDDDFDLMWGLRLWILYNMRALQNSVDLCRVFSSNEDILADPLSEVQRISDELTTRCGVISPKHQLTQEVVDKFINSTLQHNKRKIEAEMAKAKTLVQYENQCVVKDYNSEFSEGTKEHESEKQLYIMAMKIFCDLKSEKAYQREYEWPALPQ